MNNVIRAHDYQTPALPKLVDIKELSRLISVPIGTLYNWVYLKRIPFINAGRSLQFDALEVVQSMPHFPQSNFRRT